MSDLRVDHVIWAVRDLELAGARFREEFGLGSVAGGRHPGWGTANRIIPMGHDYIELVAVVDREQAAASHFGRAVLEATASGRELVGWAVATDDLSAVARRRKLEVTDGSRTMPDGSALSWRLAGVAPALASGALPFFIQWDAAPEHHPGRAVAVEHSVRPSGIARIEVAAQDGAVRAWLGDHELPLRISPGPEALSAIAISTSSGELLLR